MKTVFIRALDLPPSEKGDALRLAVAGDSDRRFDVVCSEFRKVPRSPFAYWASPRIRDVFTEFVSFESDSRSVKQGLATADDFRFVRLWTEAPSSRPSGKWFPFTKGGRRSPFYADVAPMVNWGRGGLEIWNNLNERGGVRSNVWMLRETSTQFFFRPGLTWPLRGVRYSAQLVPPGCVFSVAGKMAFAASEDLAWTSAIFNSTAFDRLIAFFAGKVGGVQYEVGLVQQVPFPTPEQPTRERLSRLATEGWSIGRRVDSRNELSHAFVAPAVMQAAGSTLAERVRIWLGRVSELETQLAQIQAQVDEIASSLYRLSHADLQSWDGSAAVSSSEADEPDDVDEAEDDDSEVDSAPMVASLLSWSLGVAFGRFDVRLATGEREAPPEPEPFDPLPVCSPGILTGDDGLPVAAPPAGYPLGFPLDGILVDDPGHPRDVVRAARAVFEAVFDDANARWHEAAELLGTPDLRTWFARDFFEPHIKRYSKSRRKAPIYWQLATASSSYSVWLYIHRATGDTLFRVLNDFVGPKLDHETAKLDGLTQEAGANPSAAQRREIEQQETFVGELQALKTEVARVAPLWKPNLDDGVILNFAPLWRLVPQSRSWQGECRKAWDKLVAGDYDWAHLAMHLWPERVVPKCVDDRSLAIAHGLEEVFWHGARHGAWRQREGTPRWYAERDVEGWRESVEWARTQLGILAVDEPDAPVAAWWKGLQEGDGAPFLVAMLFPKVAKERMENDEAFRTSLAGGLKRKLEGQGTTLARENQSLMVRILSLGSLQNGYTARGADHALNEVRVLTQALRPDQLREIFARFADEVGPSLRCGEAADLLDRGALDTTWLGCRLDADVVGRAHESHDFARTAGLDSDLWSIHPTTGQPHLRLPPEEEVERQIAWRESSAVKVALSDLLSAPTPSAASGRRARGKVASARRSAPKPAPAAPRTRPDASTLDDGTLRAVKDAIASVADGASKADVVAATRLSDSDWNKAIATLLERGEVTKTGEKRGTRYCLALKESS